ncbi:FtsK/SpoIIIE family DNA translocase [Parvularcula dongshanensis]|uniref:DNA translocase FtsK n=1 Tax=Parvularcula dongshanensis TaxID=1173995 RepID=A0A840I1C0_9PROT|nr:DNA translocase FtsK 4TM domain-containing protein [Parvularcula dongshanensis]MBB4658145.1 S-DNA-T family DNA segregation ATPase FtsK/SpoIIIE [Parvularcula dongshanensis]
MTHSDLPPSVRAWRAVRWLILRAGAGALMLLCLFVWGCLASFDVSDPSLSTATGRTVPMNWGGHLGADLSDVLLQALGGAALVLPLVPLLWGWTALRRGVPEPTPASSWWRLAAWAGGLLLLAGFAACLPRSADWPFVASMGGVVGGGVKGLASLPFAVLGLPGASLLAAIILAGVGIFLMAHAGGVRRDHVEAGLDATLWCWEVAADWGMSRLDAFKAARTNRAEPTFEEEPKVVRPRKPAPAPKVDAEPVASDLTEDDEDEETIEDGGEDDDLRPSARRRIIREVKKVPPRKVVVQEQPAFDPSDYQLPPRTLLKAPDPKDARVVSDSELEARARQLETVLADFKVRGEIIGVRPGPVVTLYELEPAAGVKSSRVIGLADDIARSMSAIACRVAVVPGRNAIGIELPNDDRETVFYREMLEADGFARGRGLNLALGKDIGGEPQYADLAKMPHLLIAGTTGSGKSVGINTMILSLLYRLPPDQCKLIMIDPKMLELSVYEGIPHLLAPVVTDPRKAVVALKWTVREMEERYQKMSKVGVRNIHGFNERVKAAEANGEELTRKVHAGYDAETGEPVYEEEPLDYAPLPYIVVVIDEVADLMMVAGKDIEAMVQRLAQMARAAGIHLIMATQRPSVDVITGTIKANFPTRISFQVTSKIDSRTILGEQGAEQLLGMGDMLYMAGGGRITRVHGAFVADDEVEKIVAHLKKQGKPDYVQEVTEGGEDGDDGAASALGLDLGGNTGSGDALFDQAVAVVARDRKASTSYIQRRLQIGYNRAASLIEKLEEEGIVSPANHAGKREVLIGEDAA